MVFGQAELFAVPGLERIVLGRRPVVDGLLIQVSLDVGSEVQGVALLRPKREEIATAVENVGGGAGLHIFEHFICQIFRVGSVENTDVGVLAGELGQHFLGHAGKPFGAPVGVHQLGRACAGSASRFAGQATGRKRRPAGGQPGQSQEIAAVDGVISRIHLVSSSQTIGADLSVCPLRFLVTLWANTQVRPYVIELRLIAIRVMSSPGSAKSVNSATAWTMASRIFSGFSWLLALSNCLRRSSPNSPRSG
jgi:hypothetical protein